MNDEVTFEVWIQAADGRWGRAVDKKSNCDLWKNRTQALALAGNLANDERIVRVVGIKRTLSFTVKGKGVLDERTDGAQGTEVRDRLPDEGRGEGKSGG